MVKYLRAKDPANVTIVLSKQEVVKLTSLLNYTQVYLELERDTAQVNEGSTIAGWYEEQRQWVKCFVRNLNLAGWL